jgi:DNA-binding MarR family transcriptional regulator
MIDDIRNWFGDIASGKIKDAHLALSEKQNASFLRDIDQLVGERDVLRAENIVLKSELADSLANNRVLTLNLEEAVATHKGGNEELPEGAWLVLGFLAEAPGRFGVSRLQAESGIEIGRLHLYLDALENAGLADKLPHNLGRKVAQVSTFGRAAHYKKKENRVPGSD